MGAGAPDHPALAGVGAGVVGPAGLEGRQGAQVQHYLGSVMSVIVSLELNYIVI